MTDTLINIACGIVVAFGATVLLYDMCMRIGL